jgi:hypothetical protein
VIAVSGFSARNAGKRFTNAKVAARNQAGITGSTENIA